MSTPSASKPRWSLWKLPNRPEYGYLLPEPSARIRHPLRMLCQSHHADALHNVAEIQAIGLVEQIPNQWMINPTMQTIFVFPVGISISGSQEATANIYVVWNIINQLLYTVFILWLIVILSQLRQQNFIMHTLLWSFLDLMQFGYVSSRGHILHTLSNLLLHGKRKEFSGTTVVKFHHIIIFCFFFMLRSGKSHQPFFLKNVNFDVIFVACVSLYLSTYWIGYV